MDRLMTYCISRNSSEIAFEQFHHGFRLTLLLLNNNTLLLSNSSTVLNLCRDNRGKYAERESSCFPWFNRVDLGIEQDITGRISHTAKPNTINLELTS